MKKLVQTGQSLNARMASLTAAAEASMSNYMGDLTPSREEFISGSRHSNFSGNANGVSHKQRMKPIIIDITNTDDVNDLIVPIFSKFENFQIPFNGLADFDGTVSGVGKGVIMIPKNYSITELKDLTAAKPFTLAKTRYKFGDATQLDMEWIIRQKVGSSITTEPYYPALSRGLDNVVSDTLVDEDFFMEVNGGSTLLLKIGKAPSATLARKVQVAFYVDSETDIASALKGQAVVNTYTAGK